jgi:flagellum-specific ATP synthase
MASAQSIIDARSDRLTDRFRGAEVHPQSLTPSVAGRVVRMIGLKIEAAGCTGAVGSRCLVRLAPNRNIVAEIVGFSDGRLVLMPESSVEGLAIGAPVIPLAEENAVAVGEEMMGRVLDGAGQYIDGGGDVLPLKRTALRGEALNPLSREAITEPLDVGVRAINALTTIGKGQRLGLFAGSGVGKSTLLGMLTRNTKADVIVVALVGERGREVRDFVDETLGPEGLKRAIVIATPADQSPLMRVNGAWRATAIAEYFRDQGKNVLLLMDSLTRFAQAQREIGLAAGEPPVSRGYTPSVFSLLPRLVERAGNNQNGSITAIYTVLVEGDDLDDPIADASRAILDGHIVLSRQLADEGVFPAVDISASISRAMVSLVDEQHYAGLQAVKEHMAAYHANRDLITIGAYQRGSDPRIDAAIQLHPHIMELLRQPIDSSISMSESVTALQTLTGVTGEQEVSDA